MKAKIRLDTMSDIQKFVAIATSKVHQVYVTDNQYLKVSAKSLLGMLYALEFEELWCESEEDIYHDIEKFIIE